MSLIVLRHGESIWNKENLFTGWRDVSLSSNGIKEAERASTILKNECINYIFTSDLERTVETAIIIRTNNIYCSQNYTTNITQTELLRERDYGELTGKNKTELTNKYGDKQVTLWRRSYYERPPNGENLHDVKMRVGSYYDSNILPLLNKNENVLIVSHGNSLRALFVHLGLKTDENIDTFELSTGIPIKIDIFNQTFSYINFYNLCAYQILDSRGFPTIEVKCIDNFTKKCIGMGSSPSGASCGSSEVLELRDGDSQLYQGKSVFKAVNNVSIINQKMILNNNTIMNLINCDDQLNMIDSTKSTIGGNTTTAVSFCLADAGAHLYNMELYEYISHIYGIPVNRSLPTPFVNIINGGKHSVTGELKIQEFMIFPKENISASKKNQIICEVYQTLQKILVKKYGSHAKSIGDEGGFCPPIYTCDEALNVIEEAIIAANYIVGEDVFMALDCAASEYYDEKTKLYEVEKNLFLNSDELISFYSDVLIKHPALKSIEDGFHETDYDAWKKFTSLHTDKIMIVGDDLFTTNKNLICKGLDEKWANTLLLKVNQIGTISEAIEGAKLMFEHGNNVIVSHRSGETNHSYIVDIAIGIGAKYLKIGSPCRGERVAKFNRLLEIEQHMIY